MKGCLRFNLGLEHKLSITQYNMETVVIESLFMNDSSVVIFLSKCLPCSIIFLFLRTKICICGATMKPKSRGFKFYSLSQRPFHILSAELKVYSVNRPWKSCASSQEAMCLFQLRLFFFSVTLLRLGFV